MLRPFLLTAAFPAFFAMLGPVPADAQTDSSGHVLKISHTAAKRYWLLPPWGSYRRYEPPRYQKRHYERKRRQQRIRAHRPQRPKAQRPARSTPMVAPWAVKEGPKGTVQLVISLPAQTLTIYKGGEAIATSPVSSGRAGYETPAGVFSVLQKRRVHFSRKYDDAPMPYMQRLTWSGIALHGGHVPDHPASHGCIRLPHTFASQLYSYTRRGVQVVVTGDDTAPSRIVHPALIHPAPPGADSVPAASTDPVPQAEVDVQRTKVASLTAPILIPAAAVSGRSPGGKGQPADPAGASRSAGAALDHDDTGRDFTNVDAGGKPVATFPHPALAVPERSRSPLRVAVTTWTEDGRIEAAQKMLDELGHDPGPADGKVGPATTAAIEAYQRASGLPVDGKLTDALFTSLRYVTGRPPAGNAHLYVRQDGRPVFDAPVSLAPGPGRIGTHLYTAVQVDETTGESRWTALTLTAAPASDAERPIAGQREVLDRLSVPETVRKRLADMLTAGSTLIVTDTGISRETGPDGDLVVLAQ